jgi:hypothetical protein
MSRADHLAWCKQRALEYLDAGDRTNAIASMISDLRKHPELEDHAGIFLFLTSAGSDAQAEGLVGRPLETLFDKRGSRLIVKLKTRDF